MVKGNPIVASETQVVLNQEDLVTTVAPSTPPKQCPAYRKSCFYCKKEGHFSKFCCTRAHSQSSQCKSRKDINDLEPETHYPEQFHSFDFEQNSFNTIYFGKNIKGPQGNSNVLFDEIDGLEHILTDLHIQGTSNPRDYKLVSTKYQGLVLRCRFKADSGAAGNLLPYNVFCELFPGIPNSITKNSINHRVCLVAYNKEEIKQYGSCMLKVNYSGSNMVLPFYVVSSMFKPIIGLDASCKLGLLTINCLVHQSWTSSSPTNTTFDAVSDENDPLVGNVLIPLTKEWTVGHPKYKHLFKGIGRFKCDPVHITLSKDAVPVQKPPRRVPLALKEQFQNELDNMVSQGNPNKIR